MTRKEVQAVIDANPGKQLYLYQGYGIRLHTPISKSSLLRVSSRIHSVRVSTFGEERPDLARYLNRPGGRQALGWDREIVTFDATQ